MGRVKILRGRAGLGLKGQAMFREWGAVNVPDVGVLTGGMGQEPGEVGQVGVKGMGCGGSKLTKQQSQQQQPGEEEVCKHRGDFCKHDVTAVVNILIIIFQLKLGKELKTKVRKLGEEAAPKGQGREGEGCNQDCGRGEGPGTGFRKNCQDFLGGGG